MLKFQTYSLLTQYAYKIYLSGVKLKFFSSISRIIGVKRNALRDRMPWVVRSGSARNNT